MKKPATKWHTKIAEHKAKGRKYTDLTHAEKLELSKLQPNFISPKKRRDALAGRLSGIGPALGSDHQQIIKMLTEQYIEELRAGNLKAGKPTADFKFAEKYLREEATDRLNKFETHCTEMRSFLNLTPFTWEMETTDRIERAIRGKKLPQQYQPYEIKDEHPRRILKELTLSELLDDEIYLADENQPDPQHFKGVRAKSGQHFKQRNVMPELRVNRSRPPSQRSLDVLKQFKQTGRAQVNISEPNLLPDGKPYPGSDFDLQSWKVELKEICKRIKKPIVQVEPLDSVFEVVSSKYNKYLRVENDLDATPEQKAAAFKQFMESSK